VASVEQELISRGTLINTMAGLDVVPAPEPGLCLSLITGTLLLASLRRRRAERRREATRL
jgi:hypothetical protein